MNYQKLSIVVPVYNEQNTINEIIEKIIKANCFDLKKEIIVIDDGSTDNTTKILRNNTKRYQHKSALISGSIRIFYKNKNEGKGAALKEGFLKSTGDIVLVQDSDLEYDPNNYLQLLDPFIINEADVVYGSRFISQRPHRVLYFWHFVGNVILTILSNICTNLNLTDIETGYKVFKGDLVRKMAGKLKSKRFGFEPEITARIARIKDIKIFEVGISYFGRTYQEGKKINWKDGLKAICQIFKYNFFD